MVIFATIEDLNARRDGPITGDAKIKALELLEDASSKLQLELEKNGINWQRRAKNSEAYAHTLTSVTCAMVDRAMSSVMSGIKSRQQTAGPYSYTDSFANPTGDMYILSSEKATLGIDRGKIGCIPPIRQCQARR